MAYVGRTLNLETRFGGAMRDSIKTFRWTKKLAVSTTYTCVTRRNAKLVGNAIIHLLQPLIDLLHTITGDNGKEFADHERIDKDLNIDFFFGCHYSA
jgi:IS30 family transposase